MEIVDVHHAMYIPAKHTHQPHNMQSIFISTKKYAWAPACDFIRTSATTSTTNIKFKNFWTNHGDDNDKKIFSIGFKSSS